MSQTNFKIFSHWKHREKWDKHVEYIEASEEFTRKQKNKILEAYSFLRQEFGEGFLKQLKHPLHPWYFPVLSKIHYFRFLTFTDALIYFANQQSCNYDLLLSKLRSPKSCKTEGIPFLEIGNAFRQNGFDVIFEPDVTFDKNPDLKIINKKTEEELLIEISTLNPSQDREEKSYTYFIVNHYLDHIPPRPYFSGKIYAQIVNNSEQIQDELGKVINEAKRRAINDKAFHILRKEDTNGIVEIGFAHESKKNKLERWATELGLKINNIEALPFNTDETDRLKKNRKIKRKAKQIGINHVGLIYVPVDPLYFYLNSPEEMIKELERKLHDYPNIFGMVLYSQLGTKIEDLEINMGRHYYSEKMVDDLQAIMQYTLLICNGKFNYRLSTDSEAKIRKAISNFNIPVT